MFQSCIECKEVDGIAKDVREGTIVCMICGRVQELHLIDETLETRSFTKDCSRRGGDFSSRIGSSNNTLLSDSGLSTSISGNSSLSRWAQRSLESSSDRSLRSGFESIENLQGHLNLSEEACKEAKRIFKTLLDGTSIRGKSLEALTAACLYLAGRDKNQPRPLKEIARIASVKLKDLNKALILTNKFFKPAELTEEVIYKYGRRIASQLELPIQLQMAVGDVARKAHGLGIVTGRNPMSVASAATYIVGAANRCLQTSLNSISQVADVREPTIKMCIKIMSPYKHELLSTLCAESA